MSGLTLARIEQNDRDRLALEWERWRGGNDGEVSKLRSGMDGCANSPRWIALQALARQREHAQQAFDETINRPETEDFQRGVVLEAAHQRERWGSANDAGKSPFDWFWLIGFLAQKAAAAEVAGDLEKAKHHTISTAAALANWHLSLAGADTSMRPGIGAPAA
jgi:hypothetical protein